MASFRSATVIVRFLAFLDAPLRLSAALLLIPETRPLMLSLKFRIPAFPALWAFRGLSAAFLPAFGFLLPEPFCEFREEAPEERAAFRLPPPEFRAPVGTVLPAEFIYDE